jgi:hypothetical protein
LIDFSRIFLIFDSNETIFKGIQVIATALNAKQLFPTFTRAGRFDKVLQIQIPSKSQRVLLFEQLLAQDHIKFEDSFTSIQTERANETTRAQSVSSWLAQVPSFCTQHEEYMIINYFLTGNSWVCNSRYQKLYSTTSLENCGTNDCRIRY